MIKWLLSALLVMSIILNIILWEKLGTLLAVVNEQADLKTSQLTQSQSKIIRKNQANNPSQNMQKDEAKNTSINRDQVDFIEQNMVALKAYANRAKWQEMQDTMDRILDDLGTYNNERQSKVLQEISQLWFDQFTFHKAHSVNASWVDAMRLYIDRVPDDLAIGNLYIQYLVEQSQYEEALAYFNYLKQLFKDQQSVEWLTKSFDAYFLAYLEKLKQDNEFANALNFLNIVLQYEVLNIPYLIQQTDLLILIGDYQRAQITLEQFEYELEYQTQVDQLKSRISNAPVDRSIALRRYGQQFIVNTLFDDGFKETTVPLLIDTGASISVVDERVFFQYMDSTNIRFIQTVPVDTAGGRVSAKLYEIERVRIGEFEINDTQFVVLPIAENKPYQGLLGMSFLNSFDFNIDQKDAKLSLE